LAGEEVWGRRPTRICVAAVPVPSPTRPSSLQQAARASDGRHMMGECLSSLEFD
jgi:hypothetical protein